MGSCCSVLMILCDLTVPFVLRIRVDRHIFLLSGLIVLNNHTPCVPAAPFIDVVFNSLELVVNIPPVYIRVNI